jgi:hypothetical protein
LLSRPLGLSEDISFTRAVFIWHRDNRRIDRDHLEAVSQK